LSPLPIGHIATHPLPSGIANALNLAGYQLLADVGGVGTGRLGAQVFLLISPDPEPGDADAGTQISLHQRKLGSERELPTWLALAAQLGYLRLSGYRLALDREGLRTNADIVNPGTGAVAAHIPAKHPGRLFGGGSTASGLLASLQSLPPAAPPPDLRNPELTHQVILALALQNLETGGAEAAELADRAIELMQATPTLDPREALAAAREKPA
jgi:hypothetical protein